MAFPPERALDEPLRVIRLHHPSFSALDSSGAQVYGGRWNSPGAKIVYAALTYGGAILETRVHATPDRPPRRDIAVITIPAGVRVSEISAHDLPDWDDQAERSSRAAGDAWIAGGHTVALIVPSKPGAPLERNIALNLAHPDAAKLHVESLGPVPWDTRLFGTQARPHKKTPAPRKKK
ncbi:MAG TPA: RES domain-containing protein [Gemmatimonadaceae bacterium]|jgi:RES domain-containing protein